MMYKEGEKVVLKVDKPAVSERLFGRKGEIFEIYEVDPYDDYCYGLVNDRGVFFWVRAEDVEKHDPDKLTIKHPFELYDLPYTLREIVSRIETLEKKVEELEEANKVSTSGVPPFTAKLHTGEVIVPHNKIDDLFDKITAGTINASAAISDILSETKWHPKTNNELRKELIEEAKNLTKEITETRELFGEKFYFYVNPEKRVVTCVIKEKTNLRNVEFVKSKGIARCHPSDVFNREIGEYVAMCRATGHIIPEKFLDPVQPDKLVKGFRYTLTELGGDDPEANYVDSVKDDKAFTGFKGEDGWIYSDIELLKKDVKDFSYEVYLDDTNAEY